MQVVVVKMELTLMHAGMDGSSSAVLSRDDG